MAISVQFVLPMIFQEAPCMLGLKKQEQGDLSCQSGGHCGFKVDRDKLRTYVEQNPDAHLYEIATVFDCGTSTIFYALQSLGITYKKKTTTHTEQDTQKVKDYQDRLSQLQSNQDYELVYIDETGIDTYLHRTHARSLKSQQVYDKVSSKRYQRLSLVVEQIDNKAKNLIAPLIYQNTMVSSLFETWFEQMLLPCLNKTSNIILDNARFHRMKHLQALANNTTYNHIILPLPPYSPNLNPIEQTWVTIKKWIRSHPSNLALFKTYT